MEENKSTVNKTRNVDAKKIVNIIAIVVCVILLPVLIINCTLIVKGLINPDEVPMIFNRAPLIVLTESMEPEIKAGDLIICKKVDAKDVKIGDVISFIDPEGNGTSIVTHEVNEVLVDENGKIYFRTQGVNNNVEDKASVPEENLVGVWTGTRFWALGSIVLFMQSTAGVLICVLVPIGIIAVLYFMNKKKADKSEQDEKEKLLAELNELRAKDKQNQEKEPSNDLEENKKDGQ